MHRSSRAFTLIELLVVIAIIGLLSSVVLASLNSARGKAADARRKADLEQIRLALEFYYDDHSTYVVTGAGYAGGGSGWFSYDGGSYPQSVAQQLVDLGYMGAPTVDPSGAVAGNQGGRSGYMIAATADNYTLWANLENPSTADVATLGSCALSTYDGYSGSYPSTARANYCIGN